MTFPLLFSHKVVPELSHLEHLRRLPKLSPSKKNGSTIWLFLWSIPFSLSRKQGPLDGPCLSQGCGPSLCTCNCLPQRDTVQITLYRPAREGVHFRARAKRHIVGIDSTRSRQLGDLCFGLEPSCWNLRERPSGQQRDGVGPAAGQVSRCRQGDDEQPPIGGPPREGISQGHVGGEDSNGRPTAKRQGLHAEALPNGQQPLTIFRGARWPRPRLFDHPLQAGSVLTDAVNKEGGSFDASEEDLAPLPKHGKQAFHSGNLAGR